MKFVKVCVRHDMEVAGVRIPGRLSSPVAMIEDLALYQELAKKKLVEPYTLPILRRPRQADDWKRPDGPSGGGDVSWPDVYIAGRTVDGKGGGERSLKKLKQLLDDVGYWTVLGNEKPLFKNYENKPIYPKVIIVQNTMGEKSGELIRNRYPKSIIIQYVQNVSSIDKRFGNYDYVMGNSKFTSDRCRELGATNTIVCEPPLEPDWARCEVKSRDIVFCSHMGDHKGGFVVEQVAKLLPDVQFVGVKQSLSQPETKGNITYVPWIMDMREYYSKMAVLLHPCQCEEAYGRTPAEALGNGIPVVTSELGNLPYFKEYAPNMVDVVAHDAEADVWSKAVTSAIKKKKLKRHEDIWKSDIVELVDTLKEKHVMPAERRGRVQIKGVAGAGDALIMFPVIQELAKKCDVYISKSCNSYTKEVFQMSPFIIGEDPPSGTPTLAISPYDINESKSIYANELRQKSIERRAMVKCDSYQPKISLDKEILLELTKHMPPKFGRKYLIGLAMNSNTGYKCYAKQKELVAELEKDERFACVILHSRRTLGDSAFCTDIGGKYSLTETIHLLSLLDGVISVDTGIAHFAGALQTPLAVLMGVVGIGCHIQFENVYSGRIKEVTAGLKCQPCWGHEINKCKADKPACMKVEPKVLIDALAKVMGV